MKKIIFLLIFLSSFSFSATSGDVIFFNGDYYKLENKIRTYYEIFRDGDNATHYDICKKGYGFLGYTGYMITCGGSMEEVSSPFGYKFSIDEWSFSRVSSCSNGKILDNGICIFPIQQCSENMKKSPDGTACVCKDGYNPDDVTYDDAGSITTINTCKPKKNCPPQMKYFWTDKATDLFGFQTEYYDCVPRTDLSEADCEAQGGEYFTRKKGIYDEGIDKYTLIYGEGCVNYSFLQKEAFWDNFSFLMSGFILNLGKQFPSSLVNKAISEKQLLLEYKNKQGEFPLTQYEPIVEDLGMTPEGVLGKIGFNPKNAASDVDTTSAYNKFLKDNGYIKDTSEVSSSPVNNVALSPELSQKLDDLFYKGGDELGFKDNMLGSANMNISGAMPDLSSASSAKVGAQVATKIDLNSYLVKNETKSYPVSLVKQYENTAPDGSVATSYKGTITYPDSTTANVTINQTKQSTGAVVNEVGYSYIVDTSNGTKTFNGSYTTTTDATGTVTNTVTKPSTVTQVNDDGSVSTSTNAGSSSVETDKTETAVNLSPITSRLDQIKTQLSQLQKEQLAEWEYTSPKTAEATASLNKLVQAFTDFSLSLDTLLNFADGLVTDLKNLFQAFEDAKNMFDDKPTVSIPSGTCPFSISGANRTGGPVRTYTIDPCYFVAPRKPILTIFFTLLFSWLVIMFAIKHLFNTTPH